MMLATKAAITLAIALVPVMLALAHRGAGTDQPQTVIDRPRDPMQDGIEALKFRFEFQERFTALHDDNTQESSDSAIAVPVANSVRTQKQYEPHSVEISGEPVRVLPLPAPTPEITRTERHQHRHRDHGDICRGKGKRYFTHHGWKSWRCRR